MAARRAQPGRLSMSHREGELPLVPAQLKSQVQTGAVRDTVHLVGRCHDGLLEKWTPGKEHQIPLIHTSWPGTSFSFFGIESNVSVSPKTETRYSSNTIRPQRALHGGQCERYCP